MIGEKSISRSAWGDGTALVKIWQCVSDPPSLCLPPFLLVLDIESKKHIPAQHGFASVWLYMLPKKGFGYHHRRQTMANDFPIDEMRSILAKVLWNFDLTLDENSQDWHNQKILALWVKPPLQVHIKKRAI